MFILSWSCLKYLVVHIESVLWGSHQEITSPISIQFLLTKVNNNTLQNHFGVFPWNRPTFLPSTFRWTLTSFLTTTLSPRKTFPSLCADKHQWTLIERSASLGALGHQIESGHPIQNLTSNCHPNSVQFKIWRQNWVPIKGGCRNPLKIDLFWLKYMDFSYIQPIFELNQPIFGEKCIN